jgi:hypothetical protein
VESAAQSHMQAVSDKSGENVRFNPLLELMVDRADSQITLEIAEGFLNLGQLDIKLPQPRRIDSRYRDVSAVFRSRLLRSSRPHGRTTRSGHLCERVKRERVVGRQRASRAERRAEFVQ